MKARNFKQANVIYAKDQPEYMQLPGRVQGNTSIFSFKLSEDEIKQVNETGTIYLKVMTFTQPLQPIGSNLLNPFIED